MSYFFNDLSDSNSNFDDEESIPHMNDIHTPEDYNWLLETIHSLCLSSNDSYSFNTIFHELKKRSFIPINYSWGNYSCDDFLDDSPTETNRVQSPFNQVYNQIGFAGEGAYGKILKVQNLIDKQIYAIKQIKLQETELAYAVKEVQFLAHLNSPRIVRYYSSWLEKSNNHYQLSIQMEFINGSSLASVLSSGKKFTREETKYLVREFALALSEIHFHGIIHRDFRPDNLMLRNEGGIAVVDFGISAPRRSKRRQFSDLINPRQFKEPICNSAPPHPHVGSFTHKPLDQFCIKAADQNFSTLKEVGTPLYSSPSQLRGEKCHSKDDIYSLGIVFFELLAQFKTVLEKTKAISTLRAEREFPKGFVEEMPEESKLILELTDPDPKKRPTAEMLLSNPVLTPSQ